MTLCDHGVQRRTAGRCLLLALSLAASAAALAGPSVYPTGVTRYDPARAYNCDVLFSSSDGKTYLIDMNGNVLHVWNYGGFPARMLNPDSTGGVRGEIGVQTALVPAGSRAGAISLVPGERGQFADLTFGYVSWQNKVIWKWGNQAPGGAALQHHDWQRLSNGDTLILGNVVTRLQGFGERMMLDPVIYEVNDAGRIVWSWRASQHLKGLGFSGARLKLMERDAPADYLHMNAMHALGPNHWAASGDRRFAPDNILISSRNANFLAIISRRTGHIVWRLGPAFPPRKTVVFSDIGKKAPFPVDGFSGQHDAHMIPPGLPGAGDLLLFDNEGEGGYPPADLPVVSGSRVLEINPVTREVVWQYTGTKRTFFSPFIGSAQRLPNGNTLIDEGIWGRFFQVTPAGKIVWEYLSPFVGRGPGGLTAIPWVYRIQAVPYSWVPAGVRQSEIPVHPPAFGKFHVTAGGAAR